MIKQVAKENGEYPEKLRLIPDPPEKIYYLGKLPAKEKPSVAIIGARECSAYGKAVAVSLGKKMGESGIQVISGMARGIDGISQEAALDAGGTSFAVLGCGVDICYPKQNRQLYERLIQQGGVLSEYEPETPPKAYHFPPRNRIVSGLSDAVIVVEARSKSGTLITVDMALEQGREVYAVPGRVTDGLSQGCNQLLKSGAGMLLDLDEFIEELWKIHQLERGAESKQNKKFFGRTQNGKVWELPGKKETGMLSKEQEILLSLLDLYPVSVEQIRLRLPEIYRNLAVSSLLMELCLEGYVVQVSPGQFRLKED